MKSLARSLLGLAPLLLALLAIRTAPAQEVWAYASASYDQTCNCVVGGVSFDEDYVADMYYDLTFEGEMYDAQATFDASDSSFESFEDDWEADNVEIGDQFSVDADVGGEIDPAYNACTTGSCGQRCTLHGGCPCPLCCWGLTNTCPADSMPFSLSDSESDSATPTCGPGKADLDTLIAEYKTWGITDLGLGCNDFTDSRPTDMVPQYGFNSGPGSSLGLASQGDITDWAYLQDTLVSGINGINNNPPAGITSRFSTPLTLEAVFRSPLHNCEDVYHDYTSQACGNHAFSRHVYGDAVDVSTNQNSQDWYNFLSWTESQVGNGACIENSTSIKNWDHSHIDWKLISNGSRASCGANEFQANPGG